MCFETTKSARAKIAKTDIVCWKVIRETGESLFIFNTRLRYRGGKRKPIIRIVKETFDYENMAIINKGYHSYKTEEMASRGFNAFLPIYEQGIYKFIIPAGTRYYENETEYVSETIMLVK